MPEAWIERWQEGRIGWHESEGNASLKKHWSVTGSRVLVPLCGKAVDLLWLESQGNTVVGVELSEIAARAFFEENSLEYVQSGADQTCFEAVDRRLAIVCGDYFAYSAAAYDACYDRGALVALSADERPRYVAHTKSLLKADAYQLIITLEYDQSIVAGPPYAVSAGELLSYWPALTRLDAYPDTNLPPKFREAGLPSVTEVVWCSS